MNTREWKSGAASLLLFFLSFPHPGSIPPDSSAVAGHTRPRGLEPTPSCAVTVSKPDCNHLRFRSWTTPRVTREKKKRKKKKKLMFKELDRHPGSVTKQISASRVSRFLYRTRVYMCVNRRQGSRAFQNRGWLSKDGLHISTRNRRQNQSFLAQCTNPTIKTL